MIVRTFVLAVLVCLTLPGHCQQARQAPQPTLPLDGSARIAELLEKATQFIEVDNDSARHYASMGRQLAMAEQDSLYIVKTGLILSSAYRRMQNLDSAQIVYEEIIPIATRNHYVEDLTIALNSAGITYNLNGHYDEALQHLFASLDLRQQMADTAMQIITLSNIAVVYYKLKDYSKALDVFISCRELQKEINDTYNTHMLLINIAHAYAYLERYPEALEALEEGLQICGTDCSKTVLQSAGFVKGIVFFKSEKMEEAKAAFFDSYRLSKETGDPRYQLDNIDYLSQIYLKERDFESAARVLRHGEQLIEQFPSFTLEKVKVYYGLASLYRCTSDFKRASDYQWRYMTWRDSLYSEDLTNNLVRLEAEHLERENQAKIASQRALIMLNQQAIEDQTLINKLSVVLLCVSVALVIGLFQNYRRKKRLNVLLDNKLAERTRELSLHRERLLISLSERDLALSRTGNKHAELIKRIKALCATGLREVRDPVAREYLLKLRSCAIPVADAEERPL